MTDARAPLALAPDVALAGVDVPALRQALGGFASGVTVVATRSAGAAHAMTATAFSSASLRPPLVLVCIGRGASVGAAIRDSGRFSASVLAEQQLALSRRFADPDRPRGDRALDGVCHHVAVTGAPVLSRAVSWVDCEVLAVHPAGDHDVVIGQVVACGSDPEAAPLLHHRGAYRRLERLSP